MCGAFFTKYDEACRHEELCRVKQRKTEQPKVDSNVNRQGDNMASSNKLAASSSKEDHTVLENQLDTILHGWAEQGLFSSSTVDQILKRAHVDVWADATIPKQKVAKESACTTEKRAKSSEMLVNEAEQVEKSKDLMKERKPAKDLPIAPGKEDTKKNDDVVVKDVDILNAQDSNVGSEPIEKDGARYDDYLSVDRTKRLPQEQVKVAIDKDSQQERKPAKHETAASVEAKGKDTVQKSDVGRKPVKGDVANMDGDSSANTVKKKRPRQESNAPQKDAYGRRQYCLVEMRNVTTGLHMDTFPTLAAAEKATKISETVIEQGMYTKKRVNRRLTHSFVSIAYSILNV